MAMGASCSKNIGDSKPGDEKLAGNIVGGAESTSDFQKENGIVGLVIRSDDGDAICTGTLISKRLVLTAAHCLGTEVKMIVVVFSKEFNESDEKTIRYGIKNIQHENFGLPEDFSASFNDIGLVLLDDEAPSDFKIAQLPSLARNTLNPGDKLIEAGFGVTDSTRQFKTSSTGVLRQVANVEIQKISADSKEILLNENGFGSCIGDSGGPAFLQLSNGKLLLVGVNSRGVESFTCVGTGVYTNVSQYLEWIQKSSEKLLTENK